MSTAKSKAGADKSATETSEQYLTFMLAGEEYGVDILRVQEIKGWDKVTRIPHSPDYVLGVINLRGAVVPIVDLRRRFGLEPDFQERVEPVPRIGLRTGGEFFSGYHESLRCAQSNCQESIPRESVRIHGWWTHQEEQDFCVRFVPVG